MEWTKFKISHSCVLCFFNVIFCGKQFRLALSQLLNKCAITHFCYSSSITCPTTLAFLGILTSMIVSWCLWHKYLTSWKKNGLTLLSLHYKITCHQMNLNCYHTNCEAKPTTFKRPSPGDDVENHMYCLYPKIDFFTPQGVHVILNYFVY